MFRYNFSVPSVAASPARACPPCRRFRKLDRPWISRPIVHYPERWGSQSLKGRSGSLLPPTSCLRASIYQFAHGDAVVLDHNRLLPAAFITVTATARHESDRRLPPFWVVSVGDMRRPRAQMVLNTCGQESKRPLGKQRVGPTGKQELGSVCCRAPGPACRVYASHLQSCVLLPWCPIRLRTRLAHRFHRLFGPHQGRRLDRFDMAGR